MGRGVALVRCELAQEEFCVVSRPATAHPVVFSVLLLLPCSLSCSVHVGGVGRTGLSKLLPSALALAFNRASTSGCCSLVIIIWPGFIDPALLAAISRISCPKTFWWSRLMGVINKRSAGTALVASYSPPRPASSIASSISARAKAAGPRRL